MVPLRIKAVFYRNRTQYFKNRISYLWQQIRQHKRVPCFGPREMRTKSYFNLLGRHGEETNSW
jgi:hypothetical protein